MSEPVNKSVPVSAAEPAGVSEPVGTGGPVGVGVAEGAGEPVSVYREAAAGVTTFFTMAYIVVVNPTILSAEGRTGMEFGGVLTAVFTALCFLPCLFLAPLAAMVPAYATAPVLVLVGAAMFRSVSAISFDRVEDSLPAFLTVVLIPLTFSITQGILWGFVSHAALYLIAGRGREIHPVMYALALVSVGLLPLEHGKFS